MNVALVCLGRLGDITNSAPIAFAEYLKGNRVTFVASREYAEILEGMSYVDPMIWDGNYSKPLDSVAHLESLGRFDKIIVAQVYGTTIQRECSSFCEEVFRVTGSRSLWGEPLIIDRRDAAREAALLATIPQSDKPMVLVSTNGKSSPFPHAAQLFELLTPLKEQFNFVDLNNVKAEKFYDLLVLYEKAYCLIATDSGPLHLAQAVPELNVIAIVTHSPDLWHGSPRRNGHKIYLRYNEFDRRKDEIVEYLMGVHHPVKATPKLVHVWCNYTRHDAGSIKRHFIAKQSWLAEYKNGPWVSCMVEESSMPRNAQSIGEPKPLPFVNDMIDIAEDHAGPDDIIVWTNDDTIFAEGITATLLASAPCWSSRFEHKSVTLPMTQSKLRANGAWRHCGADVFAFSRQWWLEHKSKYPPFILAREAFDLVLRTLIDKTGGRQVEPVCAHILHNPEWHSPACRESSGNLFNRESARAFFRSMNMPWPKV